MEEALNIDAVTAAILVTAVIGSVKLVRCVFLGVTADTPAERKQNWNDAALILTSMVVGSVFASVRGFDWTAGFTLGLTGSGVVTALAYAGKVTTVEAEQ